jgi:hypothetical protein
MDIVYIIGNQKSDADNIELRCSLRSIAKYGKNIDNVFVIGYPPKFLSDKVIKIPFEQPYAGDTIEEKNANIAASVVRAVKDKRISDHFLVSMDDHFYIVPIDFDNYPVHIRKYTWNRGKRKIKLPHTYTDDMPDYARWLVDCRKRLKRRGMPTYMFTLHRNLHVWKEAVLSNLSDINDMISNKEVIEIFIYIGNWMIQQNKINIDDCIQTWDNKLIEGIDEWYKTERLDRGVFSTNNFEKGSDLHILLKKKYPKKCKYEK